MNGCLSNEGKMFNQGMFTCAAITDYFFPANDISFPSEPTPTMRLNYCANKEKFAHNVGNKKKNLPSPSIGHPIKKFPHCEPLKKRHKNTAGNKTGSFG